MKPEETGTRAGAVLLSSSSYDSTSLASGSQEFNRRISDITHDIQALGFQDTHGDIEEEDYYL